MNIHKGNTAACKETLQEEEKMPRADQSSRT